MCFDCIIINNYPAKSRGISSDTYSGSLDNAIREFSLAKPSWYMSHYTMIYKNGERMRDVFWAFLFLL